MNSNLGFFYADHYSLSLYSFGRFYKVEESLIFLPDFIQFQSCTKNNHPLFGHNLQTYKLVPTVLKGGSMVSGGGRTLYGGGGELWVSCGGGASPCAAMIASHPTAPEM